MKKMLIVLVLLLMIPSIVFAQGFYHEFTLELDGTWELNQEVVMPNQRNNIVLVGVGKALMKSVLRESPTWWDLF